MRHTFARGYSCSVASSFDFAYQSDGTLQDIPDVKSSGQLVHTSHCIPAELRVVVGELRPVIFRSERLAMCTARTRDLHDSPAPPHQQQVLYFSIRCATLSTSTPPPSDVLGSMHGLGHCKILRHSVRVFTSVGDADLPTKTVFVELPTHCMLVLFCDGKRGCLTGQFSTRNDALITTR